MADDLIPEPERRRLTRKALVALVEWLTENFEKLSVTDGLHEPLILARKAIARPVRKKRQFIPRFKTVTLTREQILDAVTYDPITGEFAYAHDGLRGRSARRKGELVRTKARNGYYQITICGQRIFAHRIAWFLHTGEWPTTVIDHINCACLDNRIANLRPCSQSQNLANRRGTKNNKTGFKGVKIAYGSPDKFDAAIHFNGRSKHLGRFNTAEEAHAAYRKAAIQRWGEFARWD